MSRNDKIALWILGLVVVALVAPALIGAVVWMWTGIDIFPWMAPS